MNKLIIKKIERRKLEKSQSKIAGYLLTVILLTFISFIYVDKQYGLTIIELKYILLLHVFAGLVFGTLTYKFNQKLNGNDFNILKHFLWATLMYGEITCGLFFITNRQFAKSNAYITKSLILERHETFKHSIRYVSISINDFKKDIQFPNIEMREINFSNYVVLTVRNGLWGFPIINKKQLTIN